MDVTTSSIEAYHYFVRGRDEYYRRTGEAYKYFKKAIEMDSTFATAYLWLGRIFTPDIAEKNNYLLKAKQFVMEIPLEHCMLKEMTLNGIVI